MNKTSMLCLVYSANVIIIGHTTPIEFLLVEKSHDMGSGYVSRHALSDPSR